MAKPTLVVQNQPSQLDYLVPVTLEIESDVNDVTISVQDDTIIEVNNDEKTVKGIKVGSTRITVTATSDDATETTEVSWLCEVIKIETTLTVGEINGDMVIGSEQSVEVTTNAENGFTAVSTDKDIVRPMNNESPLILRAIGIGNTYITIKARKNNGVELTKIYHINVDEKEYVISDGISVGIKLTNSSTNRTVNLTTTNNSSTEDVTFYFPSRSGTLLTKEGMEQNTITMIDTPRIITPLDGQEYYTGIIIATPYNTLLNYNGKHIKTSWQLSIHSNFSSILQEWDIEDGDLTRTNFTAGFGKLYIRCKYFSEDYESHWSEPIGFTNADFNPENYILTKAKFSHTGEEVNTIENHLPNSYFGHIPFEELIDDYHYRGNIMSIRKYFEYSRYYEGRGNIYDLISFKKGEQVLYNGKLYYTTRDQIVTLRADNSKVNRNDMINPPLWNNLENLAKHDLMIKYLPLTIQAGKKYVIEVYTDAEKYSLTSSNLNVMRIEEGDTTGENRDEFRPNGTDATGAKIYTLIAVANGTSKLKFKSEVNEYDDEMPTYFTRIITVNGTNIVPRVPTPLNIDGVKYAVSKEEPTMSLTLSTGTAVVPNLVNPDIFLLDESYLEYSSTITNGNYMPSSSVTTQNTNQKSWTFSTNGIFYCQITTAANSNVGYATSTFIVVRSYGYPNYWVLDQRTNLLTPRSLIDKIGIGLGMTDNNAISNAIGNTLIGPLINNDAGYFKYIFDNHLCYITAKPISGQVAWNDIAIRDIGYKQRTIRVGGKLYWVRLPYKEELNILFSSLINGKYDSRTSDEIGLDETKPIWTLDTKIGATRTVVTWNGTGFTESELDPKSRTGMLMLVLEYIPDGQEPYNNLQKYFPNIPKAENEIFEYDPITDTGYFGVIKPENFITYNDLCVKMTGSAARLNSDWLKFYWHGQILIIGRKTIIFNINYNWLKARDVLYGFDRGGSGLKKIDIKGVTYRCCSVIANRQTPYDYSVQSKGGNSTWNKNVPNYIMLMHGEYSMWNELIYRCATGYCGYTEVNGYEWYNGYIDEQNGYQIGDNWSNFPTYDQRNRNYQTNVSSTAGQGLQVNNDTEGSGAFSHCRDFSNNSIIYLGGRGVCKARGGYSVVYAGGNHAWRSVLALAPRLE